MIGRKSGIAEDVVDLRTREEQQQKQTSETTLEMKSRSHRARGMVYKLDGRSDRQDLERCEQLWEIGCQNRIAIGRLERQAEGWT